MFDKKQFLKVMTKKPDLFSSLPPAMMSEEQIDEIRRIPRVALGEISCTESIAAIYTILQTMNVDALVPTIAYTGTEYGSLLYLYDIVSTFKKVVEKRFSMYVTDPVLLGSPQFWWALNGRFIGELQHRFKFYIPCSGCRLYLYALRIPLSKMLNAPMILSGSMKDPNRRMRFHDSGLVISYCNNLLSSFGVNLFYTIVENTSGVEINKLFNIQMKKSMSNCHSCILVDNYINTNGTIEEPVSLNQYYEQFAIPATAKILSKILAMRNFDYVNEVQDTLLPGKKVKEKKFGSKFKYGC